MTSCRNSKESVLAEKLQKFQKQQPGYTTGKQKLSHIRMFYSLNHKEFPCFTDCCSITSYLQMLAVILFCQVFNKGNYHEETVAGNTKHFIATHFEEIINRLFPSKEKNQSLKIISISGVFIFDLFPLKC